jgi:restriction system protein
MPTIWGVHNDQPQLDLVENGFISIGWDDVGDLSAIGDDKEAMKARVAAACPYVKPGAVRGTAGTLLSFAFRMQVGDIVIYPHRPDGTLNFGHIDGPYYYDSAAELHPNRRKVVWDEVGVPRTRFSQAARWEVGSAITVFRVKHHADEFLAFLSGSLPANASTPTELEPDLAVEAAANDPNAERIETYSRDFIIETLMRERRCAVRALRCAPAAGDGLSNAGSPRLPAMAGSTSSPTMIRSAWNRRSSRCSASARPAASAAPTSSG